MTPFHLFQLELDDGWTDANFDVGDDNNFDMDDDFDDPAMPSTAHPNAVSTDDDVAASNDVDSYEDLVVKRVAAYVAQSQEYIESTGDDDILFGLRL